MVDIFIFVLHVFFNFNIILKIYLLIIYIFTFLKYIPYLQLLYITLHFDRVFHKSIFIIHDFLEYKFCCN